MTNDNLGRRTFAYEDDWSFSSDADPNHHGTKQTEWNYTNRGDLEFILPPGPVTQFNNPDELGRARTVTFGPAAIAKNTYYQFDPAGNITELKDADGNVTKFDYDGLNRLRKETITLNGQAATREWIYDAAGNLVQYNDREGRITKYVYDALGRRTDELVTTGPAYHAVYRYDQAGNLKLAEDANSKYEYDQFDARGRARQVVQTLSVPGAAQIIVTLAYDYDDSLDGANRKTAAARTGYTVTASVGGTQYYQNTYQFDAAGREVFALQDSPDASDKLVVRSYRSPVTAGLVSATNQNAYASGYDSVTYFQLDQVGNPLLNRALNISTFYERQDSGLIREVRVGMPLGSSLPADVSEYYYDSRDWLRRIVADNTSQSLSYDGLGQLDQNGDGQPDYTANGNAPGDNYGYNRPKQIDGWQVAYNKEGTVSVVETANGGSDFTNIAFQWDHRNRLLERSFSSSIGGLRSNTVDYYYDVFNNLIAKRIADDNAHPANDGDVEMYVTEGGKTTLTFKFESGATTPVLLARSFNSTSGSVYAVDAQPYVDGQSEPFSTHWLVVDRQGNVTDSYRFGFDAAGIVTSYTFARFDYEAWGAPKPMAETDGHQGLFGVDPNLLRRWQNGRFDPDLQAYQFGDRWLSTGLGRWLSEDPSGLRYGTNPYEALNNSPYNFRDPTGHFAESLWDATSLAIGFVSLYHNIQELNARGAMLDAFGIVVDAVALALPFVPGGVGTAIKAARAANTAADGYRAVRNAGSVTRVAYQTSNTLQTADFFVNGYQAYDAHRQGDFVGAYLGTLGLSVRGIQGLNRHGLELYYKTDGRLYSRVDLGLGNLRVRRRAAVSPEFQVGRHRDMPSPRNGRESHHGIMSMWMNANFKDYNKNDAPAVLMSLARHHATRGIFNKWRVPMEEKMGGAIIWSKVSRAEIKSLSEKMFEAAGVQDRIRQKYYRQLAKYEKSLQKLVN